MAKYEYCDINGEPTDKVAAAHAIYEINDDAPCGGVFALAMGWSKLVATKSDLDVAMGIERNAAIARKFIAAAAANDNLVSDDPCTPSVIYNTCCDIDFERGADVGEYVWVFACDRFDLLASWDADTIKSALYRYADLAREWTDVDLDEEADDE